MKTEDGHSSNKNCGQDSEISFMNDTDEEIETAVTEEEDWVDHMKRSTDEAIEQMKNAKIQCWTWRIAMRIASLPVERWVVKAAEWNLEFSTKYKIFRAIGRPKRRWKDATTRNDMKYNIAWIKVAKNRRRWITLRKICGQCATQRKPSTRSNPTSTILQRGQTGRRRSGQHHIVQVERYDNC